MTEQSQPLVSVIMPCYMQAAFLPEAVASLQAQTYQKWECIMVSDGSTDNVADVAQQLCINDERLHFFDTENKGVSAARNFAIHHSRGEFILPLDADDKISPNYIEKCISAFTNNGVKVVYGAGEKFGSQNTGWMLPAYSFDALLMGSIIHACGMYRRQHALGIGGYDENMLHGLEDWEFWIHLLKDGGSAVMAKDATLYWRRKENSRTMAIDVEKDQKLQQYIYQKHAELYDRFFVSPLQLYKHHLFITSHWEWAKKHPVRFFILSLFNKYKDVK